MFGTLCAGGATPARHRCYTANISSVVNGTVHAFAKSELADPRPIDLLINNAGVMALPERRVSPDGHELQFATNVLGPFVLTGLLLPCVLEASASRVVTVSSYAHTQGGPTPIEDLESERAYRPVRAYAKIKLANILFTRELQRRAGGRLLAAASHPGASRTNLSVDTSLPMKLVTWAMRPMLQSATAGAEPTLRAATAPDVRPGAYYGPGGLFRLRGPAIEAETATFAHDAARGVGCGTSSNGSAKSATRLLEVEAADVLSDVETASDYVPKREREAGSLVTG